MSNYLIPEWKSAHKFWSVQLSIFWGTFQGVYWLLPAAQEYMPLSWFVVISISMSIAIAVARYLNQPGT